ncbi:MAG: hypothetical protein WAQ27_04680 [Candidatus Microsaccharimonas sp.]
MAQAQKIWHPKFVEYMNFIIENPAYNGLAIKIDSNGRPAWIATAKSEIGQARKNWAEAKAKDLGIPVEAGVYAKVMYAIHPTKLKVCQICGETMSISYVYPNANFAKALIQRFNIEIDVYDSLYEVWDSVLLQGNVAGLIELINTKFGTNFTESDSPKSIITQCEVLCRLGGKAHLGPGAMSNFPDRYDGFHTYNRCHRSLEDKGRSALNMKTYNRDRRAYELWSDGNIMAANQFMGSAYFVGQSADHVGPISLGFVHDPRYLRRMSSSDNSTKRDRLTKEAVDEIVEIQKITGVYPMSWYVSALWDYIAANYTRHEELVPTLYRQLLKQGVTNYMHILNAIINAGPKGVDFLVASLIAPKEADFKFNYTFDDLGNITAKTPRNITDRARFEFSRFTRIALQAVIDYNQKDNRHQSQDLTGDEIGKLTTIITQILSDDSAAALRGLQALVNDTQRRAISLIDK